MLPFVTKTRTAESGIDLAPGSEFPSERLDLGDADAPEASAGEPASDGADSLDDLSDWDLVDQPADTGADHGIGNESGFGPADCPCGNGAHCALPVQVGVTLVKVRSVNNKLPRFVTFVYKSSQMTAVQ